MANNDVVTGDLNYADRLWKAADTLRGQVDGAEYKHVVLAGVSEECRERGGKPFKKRRIARPWRIYDGPVRLRINRQPAFAVSDADLASDETMNHLFVPRFHTLRWYYFQSHLKAETVRGIPYIRFGVS